VYCLLAGTVNAAGTVILGGRVVHKVAFAASLFRVWALLGLLLLLLLTSACTIMGEADYCQFAEKQAGWV
jgi:hypothetical protein